MRYRERNCQWELKGRFCEQLRVEQGDEIWLKQKNGFSVVIVKGAYMHNQCCENEGTPNILQRIQHILY